MTDLKDIKVNPDNPRHIREERFEKLVKSIKEFPEMLRLRPIIYDADGVIVAGNMRYRALKEAGYSEIDEDWALCVDNLTDEQIKEFIIKDNIGYGEWDWDRLANEWDAVKLDDWGLELNGIDTENNTTEDDYEPESEVKTEIETGDIIEIGKHKIICGNSAQMETVDNLMNGETAQLLLTDPPYGISQDKGFSGAGGFNSEGDPIPRRQYNDDWDAERPESATFSLMIEQAERAIIFGGNFFADILPVSTHWLVWDKLNTMPSFGDCELLWTDIDRKSVKKYTVEYNGLIGKEKERFHPTQKPIEIIGEILKDYTEKGDLIADFYGGSGTVMVAAEQLGRVAYLSEIEPKYCQITIDRMLNQNPDIDVKINGERYGV